MGEAKRAPFEVRKAAAIARQQEEAAERARRAAEYEASLTPEQKRARNRSRMLMATMIGLSAGLRR